MRDRHLLCKQHTRSPSPPEEASRRRRVVAGGGPAFLHGQHRTTVATDGVAGSPPHHRQPRHRWTSTRVPHSGHSSRITGGRPCVSHTRVTAPAAQVDVHACPTLRSRLPQHRWTSMHFPHSGHGSHVTGGRPRVSYTRMTAPESQVDVHTCPTLGSQLLCHRWTSTRVPHLL